MVVSRRAMACQFEVLFSSGGSSDSTEAAQAALDIVGNLESKLSVYKPSSEISQINRNGTTWTAVSEETFELISLAIDLGVKTGRAFDCTAATLTELWARAREEGKPPTSAAIESALAMCDSAKISIDANARSIRMETPGMKINSGGIGKGFAIDHARTLLEKRNVSNFLIHGGQSSAVARGQQAGFQSGKGWRVAVRHPLQPRVILGDLHLSDSALGTSGPANQFFFFRGKRYGHIIDPRSGIPSDGWLSTTVLHPSGAVADALATALFVMGPEAAIKYCERNQDTCMLGVLAGRRDGEIEAITVNMPDQVWHPVERSESTTS